MYNFPPSKEKKLAKYNEESDSYTDIDESPDEPQEHPKGYWVCGNIEDPPPPPPPRKDKILAGRTQYFRSYGARGRRVAETNSPWRYSSDGAKVIIRRLSLLGSLFVGEKLPLLCPI